MSSSERPPKRARLNPGAHRDQAPLPDDPHEVQLREAPLRRVGAPHSVLQGPVARVPNAASTSSWTTLQSWEPRDDTEYALDPPDGALYDQALSQDVTVEVRVTLKKKYKRSRVSVSPSFIILRVQC